MINWLDTTYKISKFFTVGEVLGNDPRRRIKNGSQIEKEVLKLSLELDKIRQLWKRPIGISSWYRPPIINAEVGGVSNSQHILGSAADVFDVGGDSFIFEEFLDEVWGDKALGYGVRSGKGFTHLDLRMGRLRWDY